MTAMFLIWVSGVCVGVLITKLGSMRVISPLF